jgi:hypothetical protein
MAKFLLFLVVLAVIAASNGKMTGAVAARDEDATMAQRQQTMAEAVRVFSNPKLAAAADSETVHRVASFMQREMGPLGPVFDAMDKMPESSAKDEAFDAAFGLLMRHFRKLMPHGSGSCAKTDDL